MDVPIEILYILIPVIFLAAALGVIGYVTKDSRNFRSSRNRRARRQH